MLRHFKQLKVSTSITMIWVLFIGLLVSAILPAARTNAETTSPTIAGSNIQLILTASNLEQQVDWQMKFKANDQLTATRFKIEAANQKVTEIKQADQVIKADTNGYFELTKDKLQDVTFNAPLNQELKLMIDSKIGSASTFTKEGEGTYTIATTTNGVAYQVKADSQTESSTEADSASSNSVADINQQVEQSSKSSVSSITSSSSSTTSSSESASSSELSSSQRQVSDTVTSTASTSDKAAKESSQSSSPQTKTTSQKMTRGTATGTGATVIPEGAITLGDVFAKPNQQGEGGSVTTGAIVTNTINDPNINGGLPYDEITFGGQHTRSSIFANVKLDFNQSFSNRTYVNFGTGGADGFAFIMQNDPGGSSVNGRVHQGGTQAITVAYNDSDGQNLGVAGGGSMKSGYEAYRYAIQNSFAVGFDFYENKDTGSDGAAYDLNSDPKPPHMAYVFPGQSGSYSKVPGLFNTRAILKHNATIGLDGAISSRITDNTWYEFLFDYNASTQIFSYRLRNPVTNATTTPVSISYAALAGPLNLAGNNKRAYWGFSSSNGSSTGKTKIAFSELPDKTKLSLANDVLKTSDSQSVIVSQTDTTKAKYLNVDDTGKLVGDFKYTTGDKNLVWDSLKFKVDASVIDLKSLKNVKATIDGVELTGLSMTAAADGTITVTTATKPVLKSGSEVKITLDFKPLSTLTTDTLTSFTSQLTLHQQDDPTIVRNITGTSVYFWIRKMADVKLSWPVGASEAQPTDTTVVKDHPQITLDKVPTADYSAPVFYYKSTKVPFAIKVTENNQQVGSIIRPSVDGAADWHNKYSSLTLPRTNLTWGIHQFKLSAYNVDANNQPVGDVLDTITLTIAVDGTVAMEVTTGNATNSLLWTGRKVGQSKGLLNRDADNSIGLTVTDNRLNKTSGWHVTAIQSGTSDQFALQWRDSTTANSTDMTKPINVFSSTSGETIQKKTWTYDAGVLLNSPNYLSVGQYDNQGTGKYHNPVTVQWTLNDTVDPV